MKKKHSRWEELRPEADEAIRAGLLLQEFCELKGISLKRWYEIRPAGYSWQKIQKKLGIRVKYNTKKTLRDKPEMPERSPAIKPAPKLTWYQDRLLMLGDDVKKNITNDDVLFKICQEIAELATFMVHQRKQQS